MVYNYFETMNIRSLSAKVLPGVAAGVFLLIALSAFIFTYRNPASIDFPAFTGIQEENKVLFYLNFYIPFCLVTLSLYGCLFCSHPYLRSILFIAAFVFSGLAGYILDDLFTIKFNLYAACIIINAAVFYPSKSLLINGMSILLYTTLLFRPSFLGAGSGDFVFDWEPQFFQLFMIIVLLSGLASLIAYIRFLSDRNLGSEDTVKHLNSIITQLTVFNHRLQEYAKASGEEAIKTDRLRFTRDLHDKCGYVFTIIITLAEAALSYGVPVPEKVDLALQRIRKQAREGLQQTRETLYMIRDMEEPWAGSIDAIYQMKSIFEEVTGIKVDIEIGNIRQTYGRTINKILARILQEAFTNSIRHGKASYIIIHFWEFPEELTMTVTDNGIGTQTVVKRIGLAGMEERLAVVGGNLEAYSPEDGGFRIRVRIPFAANEKEEEETTMKAVALNG
jgi:signal transduction histidine kinase